MGYNNNERNGIIISIILPDMININGAADCWPTPTLENTMIEGINKNQISM